MIPFFVVDRPMSLNIIKTFFVKHLGTSFGLMTHALVSEQFRKLYAEFPCDKGSCWLRPDRGPCAVDKPCAKAKQLRKDVVRAVDCGIFEEDERPPYPALFKLYEEMQADYGVMKDFLGDPDRTLASAREAVGAYRAKKKRSFQLVLVAQGDSAERYARSCQQLVALGAGQLAIGGLLTRKERSARYSSAGSMQRIRGILASVRQAYPRRWLFVLGCYHPKRHELFDEFEVYGSDYKGWIFNYKHRLDALTEAHDELLSLERKLRRGTSLVREARQRTGLWRKAAKARHNYATTKNSSEADSAKKAEHRGERDDLLARLGQLDRRLAQARLREALRDELPGSYKSRLREYVRLVNATDQDFRVTGVHRYLADEILPKL